MKPACIAIAFCVVSAGCNPQGITEPREPDPAGSGPFLLTGHIRSIDGTDVDGALVQLESDSSSHTTKSDALGRYRFEAVSKGSVVVRVSKEGYMDTMQAEFINADRVLDFWLVLGAAITRPPLQLLAGAPLRATVQSPPCDPARWDATALCERISFTPPASGTYELVLTWSGTNDLDLLMDDDSSYFGPTAPGLIRGTIRGEAGVPRSIRIHSYYSPQAFELTASLKTP